MTTAWLPLTLQTNDDSSSERSAVSLSPGSHSLLVVDISRAATEPPTRCTECRLTNSGRTVYFAEEGVREKGGGCGGGGGEEEEVALETGGGDGGVPGGADELGGDEEDAHVDVDEDSFEELRSSKYFLERFGLGRGFHSDWVAVRPKVRRRRGCLTLIFFFVVHCVGGAREKHRFNAVRQATGNDGLTVMYKHHKHQGRHVPHRKLTKARYAGSGEKRGTPCPVRQLHLFTAWAATYRTPIGTTVRMLTTISASPH